MQLTLSLASTTLYHDPCDVTSLLLCTALTLPLPCQINPPVIVFDLPNSIKEYVHQIGRTSRLGQEGRAIVFVNEEDEKLFPELVDILKSSGAVIPRELVCETGKDTLAPVFDFQEKRCVGLEAIKSASSGVVGGTYISLPSKVRHDIGDCCSLDYLIDNIFPLFRKHIEPDIHHARGANIQAEMQKRGYLSSSCK